MQALRAPIISKSRLCTMHATFVDNNGKFPPKRRGR